MKKDSLIVKCLLVLVVSLGLYLNSLPNAFLWDDEEQVVNNPFIRPETPISYIFSGGTFGGGGTSKPTGGYYKPLMSLWYRLNYSIFGLDASNWHFTQAFIHGINGILVFLLFKKLISSKDDKLAMLLSMLFVVHPGNVESVSYISSAQEVLSAFFLLLSLLAVVYNKELKIDKLKAFGISAGMTFLALLSKETGVLGVPIIWLYLFFFEKNKKYLYQYALVLLPVAFLYAYFRFVVAGIGIETHQIIPIVRATFWERMMTVPYVWWRHVWNMVFPMWLFVSDHYVVRAVDMKWVGYVVVMILSLFGSIWLGIKTKDKRLKWFLSSLGIGMVFTLNLVFPLDMTFAERWSYLPIIFALGIFGVLVEEKIRGKKKAIFVNGLVVLMLVFGVRSFVRQSDWRDGLSLFSSDVKLARGAFDLHNNYGVELMRVGNLERAREEFEKSVELSPEWWTNWNNLGVYWKEKGDLKKARECYTKAIDNGNYFLAWENLAKVKFLAGDEDLEEFLEEGLRILPNNKTLKIVQTELRKR